MMKSKRLFAALLISTATLSLAACSRDPIVRKQKYLASGKRYAEKGKYREAIIQLSNALHVDPKYPDAHYELATIYVKTGAWQSAFRELSVCVEVQPDNLQARNDLGNMLLAAHETDKAEEQANYILQADPNNADGHSLEAGIQSARGRQSAAIDEINEAIKLNPSKPAYFEQLAVLQANSGKSSDSEQNLKHAVDMDPKATNPRLVLAAFYNMHQRYDDAETHFRAAIANDPHNLQARTSLAGMLLRKGDAAKAEEVLRQASADMVDDPAGSHLLADYYLSSGKQDLALAEYDKQLKKSPKNLTLEKMYVSALLSANENAKASTLVDALMKSNPHDPEVLGYRGTILLRNGKGSEAVSLLQQAAKDAPDNAFIRYEYGAAAANNGDPNTAEQQWKEAVRINPAFGEAQAALAKLAIARNDMDLLSQTAGSSIVISPKNPNGYIWRAIVESRKHEPIPAEADLKKAIEVAPGFADGYEKLGEFRLGQNNPNEAEKLFNQALERNPASSDAMKNLTVIYASRKDYAKGIARVQEQIAKAPANSGFYVLLAALEADNKEPGTAQAAIDKALELNPGNYEAVTLYTRMQVSQGTIGKAVKLLEDWTKIHPNDVKSYVLLGTLEDSRQNRTKAQSYYEQALELDPENPVAANNLSYLMMETGQNVDVALHLAQTAARSAPNMPNFEDTLAWAFYHKGTYQNSRDILVQALKIAPNNAEMHYHLGMVYTKLADKQKAGEQFNRVLTLSPNTPTAELAKKALASIG
jgi:Tfp pilus assembly protein PilF